MIHRGRKSAAELSIISAEPAFRPKAPSELTSEQAAEWKSIVNHMPANWFGRESHSLLIAYLRHWSNARLIAAEIERFAPAWLGRDDGLDRYEQLLKIADREHRAMASLAGKMRSVSPRACGQVPLRPRSPIRRPLIYPGSLERPRKTPRKTPMRASMPSSLAPKERTREPPLRPSARRSSNAARVLPIEVEEHAKQHGGNDFAELLPRLGGSAHKFSLVVCKRDLRSRASRARRRRNCR